MYYQQRARVAEVRERLPASESSGKGVPDIRHVCSVSTIVADPSCRSHVECSYDPPTPLSPTLSHSIASSRLNPLPHIFKLASTLVPLSLSIRLLVPSASPSSGAFLASDFTSPGSKNDDVLTEACAALIAEIGKMKRVGMGWEDKAAFLEFYRGKRK